MSDRVRIRLHGTALREYPDPSLTPGLAPARLGLQVHADATPDLQCPCHEVGVFMRVAHFRPRPSCLACQPRLQPSLDPRRQIRMWRGSPPGRPGFDTPAMPGRGWTRHRSGRSFTYRDLARATVRDAEARARIRALAIPPAWTHVWICPWPNGHLQASGRDARGRKQYRYHDRWRDRRDTDKFDRMLAFAQVLPVIRKCCDRDLARPGVPRGNGPGRHRAAPGTDPHPGRQ